MTTEKSNKKIIYSGAQPSGIPSLGNYLGALKNWVSLQNEFNCIYSVVDLHAITVRQDPLELRRRSRELLMFFLAMGLDPGKSILYLQSHVPAHAELAWILNCYTYMGELGRMTQFKEKSQKHAENINVGLFSYPILQAADILLYQTAFVPVGEDQRQHLELSRDIAIRFNNVYGNVFTVPEAHIATSGAKVMSLQEPNKKMSKSDTGNDNSVIFLLDEPNVIINKVKRAITDSDNEIRYSPEKPGISNLLDIYATLSDITINEAEKHFCGKNYGEFKLAVGETIVETFKPIQERFKDLSKNKDYVDDVIKNGGEKAEQIAIRTLSKVRKKIGLL